MTIAELREKSLRYAHEARSLLNEITDATSEERARDLNEQADRALAESDALSARADKLAAIEARDAALNVADARRPTEDRAAATTGGSLEERHADAFNAYLRGQRLTSEQRSALNEMRAQSVGTPADGGYAVPTALHGSIIETMKAFGPMMDDSVVTHIVTAGGGPLNFVLGDDTGETGALLAENTAHTANTMVFGQATLNAYKYSSKLITVSNELLQDEGVDVAGYINRKIAERVARIANNHLTVGDGNDKPNGLFTAATAGVTTTVSNAAVTADEVLDLVHSVDPAYRNGAAFMFADSTLKALRKLKDGNDQYVWNPGMAVGEAPTLFGYKYVINQDAPAVAAGAKVAVFGNLKGYNVRRVKDITLVRMTERFADADQTAFAAIARIDGDLIETAAVKALKIKA